MIYASFTLGKAGLIIESKSFEKLMKEIGYLLAKYPIKIGDSFTLKIIPKDEFDLAMKVATDNPKTKFIEIGKKEGKKKKQK